MFSAFVMAGVAVIVEGDTACPTPTLVSEALAALLVDFPDQPESHRAYMHEHQGGIELELRSGTRSSAGEHFRASRHATRWPRRSRS